MVYLSYLMRRRLQKVAIALCILVIIASVIVVQRRSFLLDRDSSTITEQNLMPDLPAAQEPETSYSLLQVQIAPGRVVLKANCTTITIYTSRSKTFSIEKGALNVTEMRPDAHDLLADVLNSYDIQAKRVVIDGYAEGIFYARILLIQGERYLDLDAKPSDALSLAARLKVPVYINDKILEALGEPIC